MTDVTVIGLGQMGVRLAELLLDAGKTVTVWNRSPGKADTLAARGAQVAPDAAAAVAASPLTLAIVADDDAFRQITQSPGFAGELTGRTVINLGTSGPQEAAAAERFVADNGGHYLDGAIQAAPSQMGQPDTPILIAGDKGLFAAVKPVLDILGGGIAWLGEAIDAAAYMDLATLSYVYGAFAGFLHGARIAEVNGIDVATYGTIVKQISPSFGAFFEHEGKVIASDDFAISESPMRISLSAVERILTSSRALNINAELPALVNGWLTHADAAGLADQELAALVQVLR